MSSPWAPHAGVNGRIPSTCSHRRQCTPRDLRSSDCHTASTRAADRLGPRIATAGRRFGIEVTDGVDSIFGQQTLGVPRGRRAPLPGLRPVDTPRAHSPSESNEWLFALCHPRNRHISSCPSAARQLLTSKRRPCAQGVLDRVPACDRSPREWQCLYAHFVELLAVHGLLSSAATSWSWREWPHEHRLGGKATRSGAESLAHLPRGMNSSQ